MNHVEIVRHTPDELVRYVWSFCFFEDRLFLCLNRYETQTRATRRHKFQRFGPHYDRHNERDSKLKEATVPLPDDVVADARNAVISKIRVGRWAEYKNHFG